MNDPDENRPPVLSYGREVPRKLGPGMYLLRLVVLTVGGFALYVGVWIGATGNFPRPVRLTCTVLAVAPIVGLFLFVILSLWVSARNTYVEIKSITDRKARRNKIIGLVVSSLALAAIGTGYFFLRLESDRATDRRAAEKAASAAPLRPTASQPQTRESPNAPASSPTNAANTYNEAIKSYNDLLNGPPIIPLKKPGPTTETAPASAK